MSQAEPARPLVVRTASAGQSDLVLELLRSASSGRRGAGNVWGSEFPDVLRDLPEGLVYLAWADDRAVGAFVLRWSDELLWGPDDGQGGYLHRLATHPDVAGRGIGRRLVDTAGELTARQGRRWLRLDCEQGNQPLRAYYEAQGFRHVRDVGGLARQTRPGHRAGSLYQRPAYRGASGGASTPQEP